MATQLKPFYGTYARFLLATDASTANESFAEIFGENVPRVAFGNNANFYMVQSSQVEEVFADPLHFYLKRDVAVSIAPVRIRTELQQLHNRTLQQVLIIDETNKGYIEKINAAQIDKKTGAPLQSKLKTNEQLLGKMVQSLDLLDSQTRTLTAEANQLTLQHKEAWLTHNKQTLTALVAALEKDGIQLRESEKMELMHPKIAAEVVSDLKSLPAYERDEKYRHEIDDIIKNIHKDRTQFLRAKAWYVINKSQSVGVVQTIDPTSITKIVNRSSLADIFKDKAGKQIEAQQQQDRQVILDKVEQVQKEYRAIEKNLNHIAKDVQEIITSHNISVSDAAELKQQAAALEETGAAYPYRSGRH